MNAQVKQKKILHSIGRQMINSPFNNLQLSRMRPTYFQGYWASYTLKSGLLRWGWLNGVAPSSTFHWYSLGNSFGIYPMGVLANGNKADYQHKISSKGMILVAYEKKSGVVKWEFWNQFVENVFNSAYFQSTLKNHSFPDWEWSVFSIIQHKVNSGGNSNPIYTYYTNNGSSFLFSSKFQFKSGSNNWSFNLTRITKSGKYLMPREWGRESFYTFSLGERNEGAGDVTALSIKYQKIFSTKNLNLISSIGYFQMPDVKNYYLNKYGLPSYWQYNFNIKWQGSKKWNRWSADLFTLYKLDVGNTYKSWRYELNKVDVFHLNLITKYNF